MPENQPGKGIGHFFGAMRIDAFRPANDFKLHMDQWIQRFRSAKTTGNELKVLIPGDPEREAETERMQNGIPLLHAVTENLKELGERFGVEWKMPDV
jgi:LDH2 family malate/lactate/ureidoglycolate dehydrogenase